MYGFRVVDAPASSGELSGPTMLTEPVGVRLQDWSARCVNDSLCIRGRNTMWIGYLNTVRALETTEVSTDNTTFSERVVAQQGTKSVCAVLGLGIKVGDDVIDCLQERGSGKSERRACPEQVFGIAPRRPTTWVGALVGCDSSCIFEPVGTRMLPAMLFWRRRWALPSKA